MPIIREQSAISSDVTVMRHEQVNRTKKVAAYCRVSTDMENQQSSLDLQVSAYQRIIDEHDGWVLSGIYKDEGLSGTVALSRPGFRQMIEDCKAGKIDYILAKSISRFARNTVDTLQFTRELKNMGVGIYFEKEKLDTLTTVSEMLLTIYAAFAQEESHSISENVKRGIRNNAKRGITRWCNIYGYKKEGDVAWVINEEEAEVVRSIFALYTRGYTGPQIVEYLNAGGVPSPSGIKWNVTSLMAIIKNEKYIGDVRMQKVYTVDFLTHKTVKNRDIESYYKEGNHEPIVDKEVYRRAQKLSAMKDTGRGICMFPYYGMFRCPHCGKPMIAIREHTHFRSRLWTCPGEAKSEGKHETLAVRRTCETFFFKGAIIEGMMKKLVKEYSYWDAPDSYTGDLKELRNYIMAHDEMHVALMEELIEKVEIINYRTMRLTWVWGDSSDGTLEYKSASDFPIFVEPAETANGAIEANGLTVYRKATYMKGWDGKREYLETYTVQDDKETGIPIVREKKNEQANDPNRKDG